MRRHLALLFLQLKRAFVRDTPLPISIATGCLSVSFHTYRFLALLCNLSTCLSGLEVEAQLQMYHVVAGKWQAGAAAKGKA